MDNKDMYESKYKLAHAYVPFQVMGRVYSPDKALCKGTLFPELYMPYKYKKEKKKC
ncbi:MAG: spore coat associated protein CotJA [Firmicutes bacterium]|nr:spore coat associated protein CotJA [Bacillota bacterium]